MVLNMKEKITKSNRQLELLKKHYDIDEINKIATINLRYEKATDILVEDLGKNEHPQFEWEVLDRVNQVIDTLPYGYKVNIEFSVEDFQEYSPETIMESFNDELELNSFGVRKSRTKTWLIAASLVITGIVLLIFMFLGSSLGWFGEGTQNDIFVEIIDIAACVFVWEAVSMVFLEHSDNFSVSFNLKKRIESVKILDNKTNEVLLTENHQDIFGHWQKEKPLFNLARSSLLFASSAFICMAFFSLYQLIEFGVSGDYTTNEMIFFGVGGSIGFIFHIIAGVGGMFRYIGSNNKMSRVVLPSAIILFIFLIVSIVVNALDGSVTSVVASASSLIFDIFYIFGCFIYKKD